MMTPYGVIGWERVNCQSTYTGLPTDLCECYLFHDSPDLTKQCYPVLNASGIILAKKNQSLSWTPYKIMQFPIMHMVFKNLSYASAKIFSG